MAGSRRPGNKSTRVETFTHNQARRWSIPVAELRSLMRGGGDAEAPSIPA